MQQKQQSIIPKSMQQDIAVSQFPADTAYELRNMRIITTGDNTSLCLTNEKGNSKELILSNVKNVLGCQEFLDKVILFCKTTNDKSPNAIYKIYKDGTTGKLVSRLLYLGDLGFDEEAPIESVGIIETDTSEKVYWVDGKNYPKVIEVHSDDLQNNKDFNFNPSIIGKNNNAGEIKVEIYKSNNSLLPGGVVQYVISYYNLGLQQTPAFIQSPLYYTSNSGRGLNPDGSQVSNYAFKITLNNTNTNFKYCKVYRILRTSIDATPTVQEIREMILETSTDSYTLLDNGIGTDADPTELLYLGGDLFTAGTITHKDNTLFLGNLSTKNIYIEKNIKNEIKESASLDYKLDSVGSSEEDTQGYLNTQWIFNSNLEKGNNKTTFFQKGEEYRFGVQFLSKYGNWSEVVYLGDKKNNLRVEPYFYNDGMYNKPNMHVTLNSIPNYIKENFIAARPVCVYPSIQDRNIICQGIVCPTVYNIGDRNDNSPYVQSSWFARPNYLDYTRFNVPYISNKNKEDLLRGCPLEFRMFDYGKSSYKSLVRGGFNIEAYKDNIEYYTNQGKNKTATMILSYLQAASDSEKHFNEIKNPIWNAELFSYKQCDTICNILKSTKISNPVNAFNYFYENSGDLFKNQEYIKATVALINSIIYESEGVDSENYNQYLYSIYKEALGVGPRHSDPHNCEVYRFFTSLIAAYTNSADKYQVDWIEKTTSFSFEADYSMWIYPLTFFSNIEGKKPTRYENTTLVRGDSSVLSLPNASRYNGEIYCAYDFENGHIQNLKNEGKERGNLISKYGSLYGIDTRIVTMHSPELDDAYNDSIANVNLDTLKFRIVGYVPVKRTYSDITMSIKNELVPGVSESYYMSDIDASSGTYLVDQNVRQSLSGYSMVNFPFWLDGLVTKADATYAEVFEGASHKVYPVAGFPVYPWQRKGSLGNQGSSSNPHSELSTKTMSNLRICLPPKYLDDEHITSLDISNVEVWNNLDTTNSIKKLNTKKLWGIDIDIIYSGNIDKILTQDYNNSGASQMDYQIVSFHDSPEADGVDSPTKFNYAENTLINNITTPYSYHYLSIGDAHPAGYIKPDPFKGDYTPIYSFAYGYNMQWNDTYKPGTMNADPIPIQYKSTGHAVFAFGRCSDDSGIGYYNTLPILQRGTSKIIPDVWNIKPKDTAGNLWQSETEAYLIGMENSNFRQEVIAVKVTSDPRLDARLKNNTGLLNSNDPNDDYIYYYWIGELYREEVINKFGGNSEEALTNNTWIPCGDIVYFDNKTTINLVADQGDTYLARYDHLKTYPLATDNVNNIVEIVSFPCETRINIDGRYDRNRGNKNNLAVSPTNFNLFNKVYSQKNNFFTYNYLNAEKQYNNKFPTQVTWSKTKTLGEEIDTWTSISLASIMDLDGDKGDLNALKRFNNEIFAFQDRGISRINFNPRVQINTSDSVPIEIGNSGKVDGKIYINTQYGCQNKWSMVETPNGIFFVDDLNKDILLFDGQQVAPIASTKNMLTWVTNNSSLKKWTPFNFNAIRTLYDFNTKDVYFTTYSDALAFNVQLGAFSSFYNYGGVQWLFNIDGVAYQIKGSNIYSLHSSDEYIKFFDDYYDYKVSIIANTDFQADKVFDTLEFRTNGKEEFKYWKTNEYPFYKLDAVNEYQQSTSNTDCLKKKFRTWRWQLGRDSRDRIRNPWTKLTLTGNSTEEMRLYDMEVTYYM